MKEMRFKLLATIFALLMVINSIAVEIKLSELSRETKRANTNTESESDLIETENTESEVVEEPEPDIQINEIWKVSATEFEEIDEFEIEMPLQAYIYYKCEQYELDYFLVMALIRIESDFTIDLISPTNDYGLMQINEMNHEWLSNKLGIEDFLDPYENVKAGTYVLSRLLDKTNGNITLSLMAYNMGFEEAKHLWKNGIYSTKYSDKVETEFERLKGEYR